MTSFKTTAITLLFTLSAMCFAAPLETLVTVADGLDTSNPETIQDDTIRLTLKTPSYAMANKIRSLIEDRLGPNMVVAVSNSEIRVQAPRDSSKRIEFIAGLLGLEI